MKKIEYAKKMIEFHSRLLIYWTNFIKNATVKTKQLTIYDEENL